ncbi:glycosyltransferase family 2 protein [Kinneretia aquatilis]|uniref:glycosyltransferase family 2 protein n=1 Tax=Kinneretia aquatilis TaxID=2070761 RepID=UPI0013FD608C|nr:glycosyltransferase family A protein [Paucibacter aquatile]
MPDRSPFWSVVIPLYNKGPYIEATVASVLAQSDPDFEIVVVDDGSTDQGASLVEALPDPRIRLIRQANAGVSAARNQGIQASRGEFVAFLDGDDLYHPECLARLRALHGQFPQACVLGGREQRVAHDDMAGHRFSSLPAQLPCRIVDNLPAEFLRAGLPFSSSSVAVNRHLLASLPFAFPPGESMGEDLDLWFRLAELGPVALIDAQIAVYRVGIADSLMGSYRALELLPVWLRLEQRATEMTAASEVRRASLRLVAEMRLTLARVLVVKGMRTAAVKLWVSGWRAIVGRRWWFTVLILLSPRLAALIR